MSRDFLGRHVIAELHGCDPDLLDDAEFITNILLKAAHDTRVTVVDYVVRKFEPQGVSAVVIISESHITIHTWPELRYAALDFYTCGDEDPENAVRQIADSLRTKNLTIFKANRGNVKKIHRVLRHLEVMHDGSALQESVREEKYYYYEESDRDDEKYKILYEESKNYGRKNMSFNGEGKKQREKSNGAETKSNQKERKKGNDGEKGESQQNNRESDKAGTDQVQVLL